MAFIKISELGLVSTLGTADFAPTVKNGVASKVTGQIIADSVKQLANLTNVDEVNAAVDAAVAALVDGAPEMLDTIRELADAMRNNPAFYSNLESAINNSVQDADFGAYFDTALAGKNTQHLIEGSNLYFKVERARESISVGEGLGYDNSTGVITVSPTEFDTAIARASFSAGNGISITDGEISSNIVTSDNEVVIANDNGHGGSGYAGMLTLTNNSVGATNINKFIRLNNEGSFEMINDAYTANIFAVTDGGQTQLGAGGLRFNDGTTMTTASATPVISRATVATTTASLAPNASANATVTAAKGYFLYSIEVSAAAWVTVYSSTATRTADNSRTISTDPTSGSGVIAEAITGAAGTQLFTPAVVGFSSEASPTSDVQLKITNNGATSTPITVTLTYLPLES